MVCSRAALTLRSPKRSFVRSERFRHRRKRFYDLPPPSHGAEPPIVAIEGRGGADALSTAGSPSLTSLSSLPPSVALLFAAILRPIFTDISPVRHEVFPRRNCDPTPILGW